MKKISVLIIALVILLTSISMYARRYRARVRCTRKVYRVTRYRVRIGGVWVYRTRRRPYYRTRVYRTYVRARNRARARVLLRRRYRRCRRLEISLRRVG